MELDIKINFVKELDLNKYILYKNTGGNYKLIDEINHLKFNSSCHFIAH